ncbi:MAG: DUF2309 domain-containing protein [Nitrospirae bacterium]|nr:DUF2309 domain-containing protein [Candidatus Manganitrophaceae bacterium]
MTTLENPPSKKKRHSDVSRMRLLGIVKLASEHIATTWPMHTFISRNPLRDLEHLDFHEALRRGKKQVGGEGYLSNTIYRQYFKTGRIRKTHLDAALKNQGATSEQKIILEGRELTQLEVLRAHFIEGFSAPPAEILKTAVKNRPDHAAIEKLADKLSTLVKPVDILAQIDSFAEDTHSSLGRSHTLSNWCDHTFDTNLTETLNQEMIKWCLPFLDEGQAPWPLPLRKKGLYAAWRILLIEESAFADIPQISKKIKQTPEHPADLLLNNLETLGIPKSAWESYLGRHLSDMPGWSSLIKWRAEHPEYPWQEACPIDLVQYLAIRLWYAVEWISMICREKMGIEGTFGTLSAYIAAHPAELFLRRESVAARLPTFYAEAVDRLSHRSVNNSVWQDLAERYAKDAAPKQNRLAALSGAWRLTMCSKTCGLDLEILQRNNGDDLKLLLGWIDAAPETEHGPVWLTAFEAGFQESLLKKLRPNVKPAASPPFTKDPILKMDAPLPQRALAQAVFCIDVRSESFRRHLEKIGRYETFGFAGFFIAFIRYLGFGSHHETDLFPAVAKSKNVIKEIPRPFDENKVPRYHAGATFMHAAHTLLHDLKENVITPYIMVESIGWFFGIPLVGKTLFPKAYQKWARRLKNRLAPPIATMLTLEKATQESVETIIASEQDLMIKKALQSEKILRKKTNSPAFAQTIKALRKMATEKGSANEVLNETEQKQIAQLFPDSEHLDAFVQKLRKEHFVTEAWGSARMERITRTGFTVNEQIFTVKTALKMMGLTKKFARLVLFCGHGSTSDNNPYEAALDCGACGGNPGNPNARVLAALANKPRIREHLKQEGIVIPEDTHFIAGQHDTTTDEVVFYDLQDLPSTHQKDLDVLAIDLKKAGTHNSIERCGRFPDVLHEPKAEDAVAEVIRRSATWSQTRPEWGLSANAAIIISSNRLIKNLDLDGRVFLHSYHEEEDPTGQFLEIILTGPEVVAQWISMEYYFSTTDNEIYGSGSKIYHNVAGRVGVMYGPTSDLRMGLPWQTVGNGTMPYHEAMRLFTIIEAPRERISQIIKQHTVLKAYFNNGWVHLLALDKGQFYRYLPGDQWQLET